MPLNFLHHKPVADGCFVQPTALSSGAIDAANWADKRQYAHGVFGVWLDFECGRFSRHAIRVRLTLAMANSITTGRLL
jgi:hypothetical protein